MSDTEPPIIPAQPPPTPPAQPSAFPPPSLPTATPSMPAAVTGPPSPVPSTPWRRYPTLLRLLAAVVVTGAMLAAAGVATLAVVPAEAVAEKENARLKEQQPAPYARVPASATPVDDLVVIGDIEGVTEYRPEGDIYFVTVSEPSQSALSYLLGRDNPAIQILTREDKFGFQTPQQQRTFALESMRTAEQTAQYVALSTLGFDAKLVPGEVLIEAILCFEANQDGSECLEWAPADDALDPGDRISAVEGVAVDTVNQLSAELEGYEPNDVVTMTIERRGAGTLDVEVELTAAPDDPDRTIVGFYPFETTTVELPFELDIDTGAIGGPSAGLAFTLTLIDEFSEGELTGGDDVAVTGTIDLEGNVGPIGGLRQKTSAVMQNGVDVFLVPAAQSKEDLAAARAVAGDELQIITVETLDDALAELEALGGDPLPALPPGDR